eukprot:Skav227080  [mRNA]  locus=scaffold1387:84242:86570:+ [translate_table: standard]
MAALHYEAGASDILAWLATTTPADARAIRALVKRSILEEQIVHEAAQGHEKVLDVCRRHHVLLTEPECPVSDDARPHQCTACSKSFGSVQALNSHRWKAHHLRCEERQYITTATCQACNRCFWTVQRLQQHLRYSRAKPDGCFAVLHARLDPTPNGQPVASEIPTSLRHLDRLPWMPAHGPHFLPEGTAWERQHQRKLADVNSSWQDAAFPAHLDEHLYSSLAPALTLTTRQWLAQHDAVDIHEDVLADRWLACLCRDDSADEAMHAEALAFLTWGQTAMYELLDSLEDPDQIATVEDAFLAFADDLPMWHLLNRREQVLHEQAPPPFAVQQPVLHRDSRRIVLREPFPCNFRNQRQFLRPWTSPVLLEFPRCDRVPIVTDRAGNSHIYILHLFSGHPRDEDCAHWVSSLASSYFPEYEVHYVPVDTAIHPLLGNLLGPASAPLCALASRGVFAYGLSGPPCETWTAARHLPPPPGKLKPRPLRSAEQLWGLRLLDTAELRQLRVGTALMFKGLEIQTDIVLHGGASVMEHPQEPEDPSFASIWRSEVQRNVIGRLPSAKLYALAQYQYGAASVKPTSLRSAGMSDFAGLFRSFADPSLPRPTNVLAGYDDFQKEFRTAAAKAYPPGLCRALIETAFISLGRRIQKSGTRAVQWDSLSDAECNWLAAVELTARTAFGHHRCADYQPVQGS